MPLTDSEIIELENLLEEKKNDNLRAELKTLKSDTNPNYAFIFKALKNQKYEKIIDLPEHLEGMPLLPEQLKPYEKYTVTAGFRGCILEGSSRSGKTWSGIDLIIYICLYLSRMALGRKAILRAGPYLD